MALDKFLNELKGEGRWNKLLGVLDRNNLKNQRSTLMEKLRRLYGLLKWNMTQIRTEFCFSPTILLAEKSCDSKALFGIEQNMSQQCGSQDYDSDEGCFKVPRNLNISPLLKTGLGKSSVFSNHSNLWLNFPTRSYKDIMPKTTDSQTKHIHTKEYSPMGEGSSDQLIWGEFGPALYWHFQ